MQSCKLTSAPVAESSFMIRIEWQSKRLEVGQAEGLRVRQVLSDDSTADIS